MQVPSFLIFLCLWIASIVCNWPIWLVWVLGILTWGGLALVLAIFIIAGIATLAAKRTIKTTYRRF